MNKKDTGLIQKSVYLPPEMVQFVDAYPTTISRLLGAALLRFMQLSSTSQMDALKDFQETLNKLGTSGK